MTRVLLLLIFSTVALATHAQHKATINVKDEAGRPLVASTVSLLRAADSTLIKMQTTDTAGTATFDNLPQGSYLWSVSHSGFATIYTKPQHIERTITLEPITLHPQAKALSTVTVRSTRPLIEMQPGKTVVNIEASITAIGSTALEALEKLPGVTVDKDGNISLKGKNSVLVLVDGKPTYLDQSQLATMLAGTSAAQISQIEIMENPPARYDAAGNGGVINIKTKKTGQRGFNGSINTTYSQGIYPKNNNSLQLGYRANKWITSLTYSANFQKQFTRIYALRTYLKDDDKTVASYLDQPSMMRARVGSHMVKATVDYLLSKNTTLGIGLNGMMLKRKNRSDNPATWKDASGKVDSLIRTYSNNDASFRNGGISLSARHSLSSGRELTADADLLGYRIRGNQGFENEGVLPVAYSEAIRATLPSTIRILSAKTDYNTSVEGIKLQMGGKVSHTVTDNRADYERRDGSTWKPDYGRSNHFKYEETIRALYLSAETDIKKLSVQAGLRYENTSYDGRQLGNVIVKDSSFSRSYHNLFPTLFATLPLDSSNTLSFSAGRRIDRPAFQKLNPFLFVINKYTYQTGNPFYRPQYTWNTEISHSYKNKVITTAAYSITKDYFSQVFPIDEDGIVYYTEGNLKSMQNLSATVALQLAPKPWWSFNTTAVLVHKIMKGRIGAIDYGMDITQLQLTMNQGFRFGKGWSAELTGFYTSKSQHDIQEIVDPAGQLSVGIAKTVLKSKGTLRLAGRDLFYTQWMKGLTYFTHATEYFKLTRDTRMVSISFSYRFGKAFKPLKRSSGAAGDEMQRVGNG